MPEDLRFSDSSGPVIDKNPGRKRPVWHFAFANLTALVFLLVLYFQPGLPIQLTVILTVLFLLIANGALWLGTRLGRSQRSGARLSRPVWCFATAGFAAVYAVFEIVSNDYASAGAGLSASVVTGVLGLLALRDNAKKGSRSER
jgi:hypothetical protein